MLKARESENTYADTKNLSDWFNTNELYIQLDNMMCKYPCISYIKSDEKVLEEARALTGQLSLFDDDDFEPSEYDFNIHAQIENYKNYLTHPEQYDEEDIPPIPPEKTSALMICFGNIELKWEYYKNYCHKYTQFLNELKSFNNTIFNFIEYKLSHLKTLNAENFAMALCDFFTMDNAYKLVANPIAGTGIFSPTDFIKIHQFTRETYPGSGVYAFYEYYESKTLQALLKADFYNALKVGHLIRRCEYCHKYFLLKKAYHTKYCGNPAPDNPKKTCSQRGRRIRNIKELKKDDPRARSISRCFDRIDKDVSRRNIDPEKGEYLKDKVEELYYETKMSVGVSYDEFEEMLQTKNLYATYNVVRKSKPVGRPKKETIKEARS